MTLHPRIPLGGTGQVERLEELAVAHGEEGRLRIPLVQGLDNAPRVAGPYPWSQPNLLPRTRENRLLTQGAADMVDRLAQRIACPSVGQLRPKEAQQRVPPGHAALRQCQDGQERRTLGL